MRSGLGLSEVAVVEDASRCSVCGSSLIAGRCLSCDTRRWSRFVHRELVLLMVLIGITVAAFFGTRAGPYRKTPRTRSIVWRLPTR